MHQQDHQDIVKRVALLGMEKVVPIQFALRSLIVLVVRSTKTSQGSRACIPSACSFDRLLTNPMFRKL